jgi:3-hydroxybutyryl-CoA dehydrogenase
VSEAAAVPGAIRRVGVIGAGQMGRGIAHVCALAGLDVVLTDVSAEALAKACDTIDQNMARQLARGRIRENEKAAALARIAAASDYAAFGDCDMVIEAATEKEAVKREIFQKLVPALKPGALIASNTSSISITRLASATDRPGKFIGMHFMNPVPVMSLVELIRGIATDDATFAATRALAVKLARRRSRPRISRPSSSTASCCRWSTRRSTRSTRGWDRWRRSTPR